MCSGFYHPSDAELAAAIKMKVHLPPVSVSPSAAVLARVPQSDIGDTVAKLLQGYDWSLVPLANR